MVDNMLSYSSFAGDYHDELVNSCVNNCIYTILRIEEVKEPLLYFNCALCFKMKQNPNAKLGYSYSCSRDFLKCDNMYRVTEHNNFDIHEYEHYTYDEIWEGHRRRLAKNQPIILLCDMYYLNYIKNPRKEHRMHGIIAYAIDEEQDKLYIIDNGKQFFNGTISIEEFKKAWKSEFFEENSDTDREILSNKVWFDVDTKDWEYVSEELLLTYNIENTKKYYYNENQDGQLYGVEGIETVLDSFKSCYQQKMDMEPVLLELKDVFFEIIVRMKLFVLFLESAKQEENQNILKDYIEKSKSDLKMWNAFYNLILKACVLPKDFMYERIIEKGEKCLANEYERKAMTFEIADHFEKIS